METIKITVEIEETYEAKAYNSSELETKTRDVKLYQQTVIRTGEPDNNVYGLIADIAMLINGKKS